MKRQKFNLSSILKEKEERKNYNGWAKPRPFFGICNGGPDGIRCATAFVNANAPFCDGGHVFILSNIQDIEEEFLLTTLLKQDRRNMLA